MSNPVVVEVLRGGRVESRHRGAGAVFDTDGRVVLEFGDIDQPVFPRSAVKAFQTLPLIESGGADALNFTQAELSLCCASHAGEPEHVALAAKILAKIGAGVDDLACGAHWPSGVAASRALARAGREPTQLHNNCSGKHSGFLCVACHNGWTLKGYETPSHPLQREIHATLEAMVEERLDDSRRGTDGCSIPTYAISLRGLARGFAKFASGQGLAPARAEAARRLREAVASEPFYVGGTDRFDTRLMSWLGARAFTKTGAEGVFCAALPEQGLGVAVKVDDGAGRASEITIAALIRRFLALDEREAEKMAAFTNPDLRNWRGLLVGAMRPAGPLAAQSGTA